MASGGEINTGGEGNPTLPPLGGRGPPGSARPVSALVANPAGDVPPPRGSGKGSDQLTQTRRGVAFTVVSEVGYEPTPG